MPLIVIKPPARQSDWKGCKVRLTREARTRLCVVPVGRTGTVRHAVNGKIEIDFDACACCGAAPALLWRRIEDPALFEFVEAAS